jgi:hypothetical protein
MLRTGPGLGSVDECNKGLPMRTQMMLMMMMMMMMMMMTMLAVLLGA